jgi:hypothetical protein
MDHDQARASFERLAAGLDATAEHLIGPGFEFARRSLANAAGAATELARLHAAEETAEYISRVRAEQDAAASRSVYGIRPHMPMTSAAEADRAGRLIASRMLSREYVVDMLGDGAVSTPDPLGPPSYVLVEHGDDCDHPGISTPIGEGEACPSCGAVARRQDGTTYTPDRLEELIERIVHAPADASEWDHPTPQGPAEYRHECRIHGDRYPCEGGCPGRRP